MLTRVAVTTSTTVVVVVVVTPEIGALRRVIVAEIIHDASASLHCSALSSSSLTSYIYAHTMALSMCEIRNEQYIDRPTAVGRTAIRK